MKTEVYSWRVSRELKTDLEREARRRKMAEGKPGGGQGLGTRSPKALATAEGLRELEPEALAVLREIFDDAEAPRKLRFDAAVKVLEYGLGRPAQRVQMEQVDRIEYVLAAHEPPPPSL